MNREHADLGDCALFWNNDNDTALHCAAQYGHAEVVRLLLEELADPATRNNRLETPLDLAALYGRLEVVRLLLAAHPGLLASHAQTHTPLHLAARNGHLSVVEVLLDAGMDINCKTEKGSALHEAALFGKMDVVHKLLNAGIDANIMDARGCTALDTVREVPSRKSREIAALIRGHMTGNAHDMDLPPPPPSPPYQDKPSPRVKGDAEQQVTERGGGPEEENPYEALIEGTSCHSLDSLTSGRSSDRDSGRQDSEGGKREYHTHPSQPPTDNQEEVSTKKEVMAEEETVDPTYELVLSPKARVALSRQDSVSQADEDDVTHPPNSLLSQNQTPKSQSSISLKPRGQKLDPGQAGFRTPGDNIQPSRDRNTIPEQFAGLLHGSSPVIEGREDLFRTLSGAPARLASEESTTSSSAMSVPLLDRDPTAIYATVVHSRAREAWDSPDAMPAARSRPPGDLKLTRSLSKSDSDLLVSPPGEEESGLGGRSESVSNCSTGKKHLERSPSFTSEWDEIEKIMNLIGAGIQFSRDPASTSTGGACGRVLDQPVGDWLEGVGLPQYESRLLLNGFDDLRFMGSDVMEEQDLREIGITDPGHRKKILHAARALPKVKALGYDGSTSLSSWLDGLGLQEYLHNFLSSGYRTLDSVKNLWELEIVNCQDLASQRSSPISHMDSYMGRSMDPLLPPGDSGRWKGSDQDYDDRQNDRQRESRLTLRPPSQAAPYGPVPNWQHQPEKLIFESCGYEASYLGSMLIKDLRGTDSTQDACAKMRRSTEQMRKLPTIILSITYRGVKFIDAAGKNVIAEHEIRNISCAAQDPDDLCTFAYITKDLQSNRHYCHVFSTVDMSLTYEIILTLGQAFEVAYQLALQAQRTRQQGISSGPGSEVIETRSSRPMSSSQRLSASAPVLESRCHACSIHRPSFLPLRSISPTVQLVDPLEIEAETQSLSSAATRPPYSEAGHALPHFPLCSVPSHCDYASPPLGLALPPLLPSTRSCTESPPPPPVQLTLCCHTLVTAVAAEMAAVSMQTTPSSHLLKK
ncbi:hypothetical protein JZ751_017386 [Albula glossodonta]|uniref:Ankyrin repeat and SAM domain-containing protein 1A-like n=1 Tax=Albula glossodonta TaxID=121402 RepID=A0A8T2PKR3_9TELE|nr:hypothetical protein JZ751_017386 [Albula glossodonta]